MIDTESLPRLNDNQRTGLPSWTYFDRDHYEVELEELFRRRWQLACHVSDVPEPGSWFAFDIAGERALIMRDRAGVLRAFHNLCRHRGSRVAAGERGRCKGALVCPFHGWSYNLDGTLRAVPQAKSLPKLDPQEHGLVPVEHEIWQGFVFMRFKPGPQGPVATLMAPHAAEFANFGIARYTPYSRLGNETIPVNWKSVRDVDNEGYHVPVAHPALYDLYGPNYRDEQGRGDVWRSEGRIGAEGLESSFWSVRNYTKLRPKMDHLPAGNRDSWVYFGLFPNQVIMLYPDLVGFYQEVPVAPDKTIQRFAYYKPPIETREAQAARCLALRIERVTGAEDVQLIKWSYESMRSSGFKGVILSDLESGVRQYHDALRRTIPAMAKDQPPQRIN
jgi:phenylpropionate dioxygenase-like ring-hydroxylating dioxygenase large terminal subunit